MKSAQKQNTQATTYSRGEEIANAITHGIGAALAIAALVILIVNTSFNGHAWNIVTFTIYGTTLVILYIMSTLYHSLTHPGAKRLFRKFDHMAILLLIAGTYTPYCCPVLHGWIGWTLLGIVWGCAAIGIVLKAFFTGRYETASVILYVIMGWACILAIKPLYTSMPFNAFVFLVVGGALYTLGTVFYVRDSRPYHHSIWHLFVLAGSVFHFFSILNLPL